MMYNCTIAWSRSHTRLNCNKFLYNGLVCQRKLVELFQINPEYVFSAENCILSIYLSIFYLMAMSLVPYLQNHGCVHFSSPWLTILLNILIKFGSECWKIFHESYSSTNDARNQLLNKIFFTISNSQNHILYPLW